MSLSRKIADAVENRPRPTEGGYPCLTEVETDSNRLALTLTACGPVGLAFEGLDFATLDRLDLSSAALKSWGDRLAARLTYLMEPLVVLEVDAQAGEAELRSRNPTLRADQSAYYEVRLRSEGSLKLRRVSFDATTRRRASMPCQITVEVLERLSDDLVATAP